MDSYYFVLLLVMLLVSGSYSKDQVPTAPRDVQNYTNARTVAIVADNLFSLADGCGNRGLLHCSVDFWTDH